MNTQEGGHRVKLFHEGHCAPGKDTSNGSCLDDKLIIKIAKVMNKLKKKNDRIEKVNCYTNPAKVHECVCKNISSISGCNSEACIMTVREIIDHLGKDADEFKNSFRPIMPKKWLKDYNEWLTTSDIETVLNQYMNNDDSFYFYGAVPIDFSNCSVSELCSIDIKDHIEKGEDKIGIVFNTDPHHKSGKHWISMYIDLDGRSLHGNPCMYYFDSFGRKPPHQIKDLVDKILQQGEKYKVPIRYLYNDERYQRHNSQCGVYSIYFVEQMLSGKTFHQVLNHRLNDHKMINYRNKYFIKI